MKIGFEAKRFFTNNTGLGNYSRFIVDALSQHQPENEYVLYTPTGSPHREATSILGRANVKVVTPENIYRLTHSTSLWRTWGMSRHPSLDNLNVFHGLSHELPFALDGRIRKVVTVHDLIFLRYPQFYNSIDVSIYRYKLAHACRTTDKIVAISQQTASDLVDFLRVDPSKIRIVYQGCHVNFKRRLSPEEKSHIRTRYNLPSKYILNVGTIEKRKNLILIVKALAAMPEGSRVPLVVIGKRTEYFRYVVEEAGRLGVIDYIMFLENVPFVDFPGIYQSAEVFVYPSLFEGFGIPLIEAIESGVPVITSVGSCFREAAGPAAVYVDPLDADELGDQLGKVLEDDDLREGMIRESSVYIQMFQPEVIAAELIALYRSL